MVVVMVMMRMVVVIDRRVFARRCRHATVPLAKAQRVCRRGAAVVRGRHRGALLRHADALC